MKQHLEDRSRTEQEKVKDNSQKTRQRAKTVHLVRAKAPGTAASELPILWTLSSGPQTGMPAKKVVKAVTEWFVLLCEEDCNARYPASRRKITESVVKFSRKNLVIKGEIFPVGEAGPHGIWRLTEKGKERALTNKREAWNPKYSTHEAVILEEQEQQAS